MRRKHMYNQSTRRTLCGHVLTSQEKRTARINTINTTNCGNCKKRFKKIKNEEI